MGSLTPSAPRATAAATRWADPPTTRAASEQASEQAAECASALGSRQLLVCGLGGPGGEMEAEKWGCGEVGCKLSCPSWCLCVECRVYSVSVSVSCACCVRVHYCTFRS